MLRRLQPGPLRRRQPHIDRHTNHDNSSTDHDPHNHPANRIWGPHGRLHRQHHPSRPRNNLRSIHRPTSPHRRQRNHFLRGRTHRHGHLPGPPPRLSPRQCEHPRIRRLELRKPHLRNVPRTRLRITMLKGRHRSEDARQLTPMHTRIHAHPHFTQPPESSNT